MEATLLKTSNDLVTIIRHLKYGQTLTVNAIGADYSITYFRIPLGWIYEGGQFGDYETFQLLTTDELDNHARFVELDENNAYKATISTE